MTAFEDEIAAVKASVEKYLSGTERLTSDAAADLAKAIHHLSDHVASLHQRIEDSEQRHAEWTTHGWTPPPGEDRPY
jgi:hypothetical protein